MRAKALFPGFLAVAGLVLFPGDASAVFPGANGRIAYSSLVQGDYEIFTMKPDGSDRTRLTRNGVDDLFPSYSPDGTRIAFQRATATDGTDVLTMNTHGGDVQRIAHSPADEETPAFSANGRRLVYSKQLSASQEIFTRRASDGKSPQQLTHFGTGEASEPVWSPVGGQIAFSYLNADATVSQIWIMGANGADPKALTTFNGLNFAPDWSAGAEEIAFYAEDLANADSDVLGVDPVTGSVTALVRDEGYDTYPAWSPNSKRIAIARDHDIWTFGLPGMSGPVAFGALFAAPDWQSR